MDSEEDIHRVVFAGDGVFEFIPFVVVNHEFLNRRGDFFFPSGELLGGGVGFPEIVTEIADRTDVENGKGGNGEEGVLAFLSGAAGSTNICGEELAERFR